MVNAMELLQNWRGMDQQNALRAAQMEQMQMQGQREAAMHPLQIQAAQMNMLAKRQAMQQDEMRRNALQQYGATGNINALAMGDPEMAAKVRMMQDRMTMRGGMGGAAGSRGAAGGGMPKPTWDAARGVFIVPPTPENPQGTVIQPQGLPKTGQERKFEGDEAKEKSRFDSAIKKADLIIGTAGEALQQADPMTTGLIGDIRRTNAGRLTGSGAYDLSKTIDTIKANLGFQELQAMREASPTGGALGAIAVQELVALQSTLASLDAGQSEDQLKRNLRKVQDHYRNWKTAVEKAGGANPAQPSAPPPPAIGQVIDGWRFKGGNPADPASYEKAK
jgi:hypothetical protein